MIVRIAMFGKVTSSLIEGSMQIINAVISSIGLHSGAPLQGGTGNNSAAVRYIHVAYCIS